MLILGIDTSSKISHIALYDSEKGIIAENSVKVTMTHSDTLMSYIDELLKNSRVTVKDIDRVAVGIGPGSFTGIRIGVGSGKGIAYGAGKEIVGIRTLDAIALDADEIDKTVVSMVDAKKERVFYSVYSNRKEKICDSKDGKIESLISEYRDKDVLFVGEGSIAYREKIESAGIAVLEEGKYNSIAVNICKIALNRVSQPVHIIEPDYVAKSQAERAKENLYGV